MGKQTACLTALIIGLVACGPRNGREAGPDETPAPAIQRADSARTDTAAVFEKAAEQLEQMTEHPTLAQTPERAVGKSVALSEGVEIDKTVHDFGDILVTDGPVRCTFRLTNTGTDPLSILQVVTSCGCTDVEWTREEIAPKGSGNISVTFKNEDGPIPFDKTLTVYLSRPQKPQLLHIRGCVHEKKKSLAELYPVRRGALALRQEEIKAGNMEQGESRSGETLVANPGTRPLRVEFRELSPQLSLSVDPNPIPAGKTAVLTYTVRADRALWGRHTYTATPVLNGQAQGAPLRFWAITKENFNGWTQEEKDRASQPVFDESTASFGTVPAGKEITVNYTVTNKGKSPFRCYAAYGDTAVRFDTLDELAPGQSSSFAVHIPTEGLPKGETTIMLTLVTNSPLRPIINLFAVGILE